MADRELSNAPIEDLVGNEFVVRDMEPGRARKEAGCVLSAVRTQCHLIYGSILPRPAFHTLF